MRKNILEAHKILSRMVRPLTRFKHGPTYSFFDGLRRVQKFNICVFLIKYVFGYFGHGEHEF
jgi:hypothetical protein